MFKKLLPILAIVAIAFSSKATVLWESETEEGVLVDWGQPCLALNAAETVAAIQPGDYLKMTISGVTEGGWPQVALFAEYGGWPPLANSGVGDQTYPYVVTFPVTNDLWKTIETEGISFSGNGAYVSKVEVEPSGVTVNKYTVWFGNKECGWGNGVFLPASLFENIAPGDRIVFCTDGLGFQVLLGGWGGLNLPAYEAHDNTTWVDGKFTVTMIDEYDGPAEYGDQGEKDVFALIKKDGIGMHGTTTLTRIDYIPVSAAGEPFYETTGHATINEEWADYGYDGNIAPANDVKVEGYEDNTIILKAWAGTEGYDLKVVYDEEENVTAISSIVNGKETTYTSGYAYAYTDADNYVAIYMAEDYDYAGQDIDTAEGYVLLSGFVGNDYKYYYAEWPLTADELATAIEDAYNDDIAQIQEWVDALTDLQETFPGFGQTETGEADLALISGYIHQYNQEVADALEAAAESWGYVSPFAGAAVAEVNQAIIGAVADREELIIAIEAAYDEDIADINELATSLEALNDLIDEEFPGYAVLKADEIAALNAAIEDLNNQATAALEAANESGVYEGISQGALVDANEALMALSVGMEEAVLAITSEYDADIDIINDLATSYSDFVTELESEFPAYAEKNADALTSLNAAIMDLNTKATDGLDAAFNTGVYEGPTQEEIMNATTTLMGLVADAEAVMTAIMNAAEDDWNKLASYYEAADAVLDSEDPSDAALEAAGELVMAVVAIQENIQAAVAEAMQTTCEYVSPVTAEDMATLDNLLAALKLTGINGIFNDADADMYFDLNGQRVRQTVPGNVYIKVVNGKAVKVLVK